MFLPLNERSSIGMSRKKKQIPPPPRPAEFRTGPFDRLKGVVVAVPQSPEEEMVEKAAPAKAEVRRGGDEAELFRRAMAGVMPLEPQEKAGEPARTETVRQPVEPVAASLMVVPGGRADFLKEVERLKLDIRFEEVLPEEEELKPLGGNRLRMLRRGVIRLDRQLDLHGLTRDEAIGSLDRFLRSARRAGEKAVLVITGKGTHSSDGPVLNQAVAAWLREQGRSHVVEFAPAPRELGGSGAFVVFLRPLDKPDPR